MKSDCGILNPLQRDGTSQNQRLLPILHPSRVQVDERDLGDLLGYARDYAGLIRYYNTTNQEDGDWKLFIEADISTLTAIIRDTDLAQVRRDFAQTPTAENEIEAKTLLIVSLARMADKWAYNSIEGLKLHTALTKLIPSLLNDALRATIGYAKRAQEVGIAILPVALNTKTYLSPLWELDSIQADALLFPSGNPPNTEDLKEAAEKLSREFQRFADGLQTLITDAPAYLTETIEAHPHHQPHMALFLAFLKICEVARDHLNEITRKHLNFYYQEVLQLAPLPAKPDEVHIIFELARGFEEQKLDKGTELKADKDALGIPMWFQTDDELIVNKAQVDEEGLKTLFIKKENPGDAQPGLIIQNLYAAPQANSADGKGAEIVDEEDGKWFTVGSESMPQAALGFAVASPMLLLREGDRIITLTCHFDENPDWIYGSLAEFKRLAEEELKANLIPYYTGPKSWEKAAIDHVEISTASGIDMTFTIHLPAGATAFQPYNQTLFPEGFQTKQPVLKIMMDPEGICGKSFCGTRSYLKEKSEAPEKMPKIIQAKVLAFLNAATRWEDIGAVEPRKGPILDNPYTGSTDRNKTTGYDIGETVSKRILDRRETLGGTFTQIEQLLDIDGLGVDKLNDLFYTFCFEEQLSRVKSSISLFIQGNEYSLGDCVIYEGDHYRAIVDKPAGIPSKSSAIWQYVPKSHPYKYFKGLKLSHMDIAVQVRGMKNLVLENDLGILNPAKPFLPFGPIPKSESKFYIGCAEVFQKKLQLATLPHVELTLDWADLPTTSFNKHYEDYTEKPANNEAFTLSVEKQLNAAWQPLSVSEIHNQGAWSGTKFKIFNNAGNGTTPPANSLLTLKNLYATYEAYPGDFTQLAADINRGFIRLVLNQHFYHNAYAASVTSYAVSPTGKNPPKQPYTPTLNSISLSYRTKETVAFRDITFADRQTQLFHIEPFGWKEFFPFDTGVPADKAVVTRSLVPEFLVHERDGQTGSLTTLDAEGTLYIGLKDLKPPQAVAVLIQMAEGSSDPEAEPPQVVWSYLVHNEWKDFETHEILSDGTNGLLTSGIIQFAMPRGINSQHTRLKAGVYWIKASVARATEAIAKTIAILPQAVKASFQLTEAHDQDRLKDPMMAETIKKMRERQAAIKKVTQPFASFGGKVEEQLEAPDGVEGDELLRKEYNEYYIRVSERLRHKQRAITIFDYERMVLQQFPDVYKVKCLNHTRVDSSEENPPERPNRKASEHAPGHVKLIVVPQLFNQNAVNPLEPMISLNRLQEIESYLQPLISGFVTLEVRNPHFEKVEVHFKVKFHPLQEANRGFYERQLVEDIKQFLSPWAYKEGEDLILGGRVHRSLILNYIEKRSYVDYVTDFQMDHRISDTEILKNVEEAVASTSSSVIVSYESHTIHPEIPSPC